ncbi:4-diphosphocytidyl-2-C-methyl-D-erythritol kinase [Cytophagales bacterium WSM2-2]|nr:4-diphosphocytidyl-2-C-methyl-D-erythritol kinase [Cytophagales bacterium WSM2-2]
MVTFPHCKINLGLEVVSRRNDGYHNIETCFYPVPRTDILEVIPSPQFSFSQSGIAVPGNEKDNLCVKAFELLQRDLKIGNAKIHLHKLIPMGAGLGGGSADGAFTLSSLNHVFGLNISQEKLKDYASQLGSDCAFFIEDRPMFGTGRGEVLSPSSLSLKNKFLVLIKPEVHVSTADAYAGIQPQQIETSLSEILGLPVSEWKGKLINRFEDSIFKKHPVIAKVKDKLYSAGAMYASMSGSGASVYGIFEKSIDLRKEFSEMDYWSGVLK